MANNIDEIFQKNLRAFLRPVVPFWDDPSVSTIFINRFDDIWIERTNGLEHINAYLSEEQLYGAIRNMAQIFGVLLNEEHPQLHAHLPSGVGISIVIPPIAVGSPLVTLRKPSLSHFGLEDLVQVDFLSEAAAAFLLAICFARQSTLLIGPPSSGKSTLLQALAAKIPSEERVVCIERNEQLHIEHPHIVTFRARNPDRYGNGELSERVLLDAAVALRPHRLLLGELVGVEAAALVELLNAAYQGSMTTLNAHSIRNSLHRIEAFCLQTQPNFPIPSLRSLIASAWQFVVVCHQFPDGRRCVSEIGELLPLDAQGNYQILPIFQLRTSVQPSFSADLEQEEETINALIPTGNLPLCWHRLRQLGFLEFDRAFFFPENYDDQGIRIEGSQLASPAQVGIPMEQEVPSPSLAPEEPMSSDDLLDMTTISPAAPPKNPALRPSVGTLFDFVSLEAIEQVGAKEEPPAPVVPKPNAKGRVLASQEDILPPQTGVRRQSLPVGAETHKSPSANPTPHPFQPEQKPSELELPEHNTSIKTRQRNLDQLQPQPQPQPQLQPQPQPQPQQPPQEDFAQQQNNPPPAQAQQAPFHAQEFRDHDPPTEEVWEREETLAKKDSLSWDLQLEEEPWNPEQMTRARVVRKKQRTMKLESPDIVSDVDIISEEDLHMLREELEQPKPIQEAQSGPPTMAGVVPDSWKEAASAPPDFGLEERSEAPTAIKESHPKPGDRNKGRKSASALTGKPSRSSERSVVVRRGSRQVSNELPLFSLEQGEATSIRSRPKPRSGQRKPPVSSGKPTGGIEKPSSPPPPPSKRPPTKKPAPAPSEATIIRGRRPPVKKKSS